MCKMIKDRIETHSQAHIITHVSLDHKERGTYRLVGRGVGLFDGRFVRSVGRGVGL